MTKRKGRVSVLKEQNPEAQKGDIVLHENVRYKFFGGKGGC